MSRLTPHLYRLEATAHGVSAAWIDRAEGTIRATTDAGVVPVFSLRHLSVETGAEYSYLRHVVTRSREFYEDIALPKRSGGVRPISSPEPVLADVQRWILKNCTSDQSHSPNSYAYRPGKSIKDAAERHLGARWLVKLDLHDFFGSISERRVYEVFRTNGYPRLLAFELARICTRASGPAVPMARYAGIAKYSKAPRGGVLPQGAPTSGALANAVATAMDLRLNKLATSKGFTFTRYSDDLTFSIGPGGSREQAAALINSVRRVVVDCGFALHEKKSRVVSPGARKVVLGLLVRDDAVGLLPEYRKRVEMYVRGCERFGLAEHVEHLKFDSIASFINHVEGHLAFCLGIDRDFGGEMCERWAAMLSPYALWPAFRWPAASVQSPLDS